ncbi:MAG: hypothetical protein ABSB78_14280 [Bacteroidota bacterium]
MPINEKQYEQLSSDVRHYDTQAYVVPTTLLLILGVGLKFAIETNEPIYRITVFAFMLFVCHAYITLFAKLTIHQRPARTGLTDIEKKDASLKKIPRSTYGTGGLLRVERNYRKWSPLWIYFYSSADRAILVMMMAALLVTLFFLIRSIFTEAKLCSDSSINWLSLAFASLLFCLYCVVMASEPKSVLTETKS